MFTQLSSQKRINIRCRHTITNIKTQKLMSFFVVNEQISDNSWLKDGKLHRSNGNPAIIHYFENGQIKKEEWYKNGKLHRSNGNPAIVSYFETGQIHCEFWYVDGQLHHPDGSPVGICYFKKRNII